ncbi:MAG: hypothetical protein K6G63_06935 [Eubacterium sp.]|nr:hypothetical protein [Eubacterium sp.]
MKYITGIHALNLRCSLDTCGDWHQSAIQWDNPKIAESDNSFFGDYGLEHGAVIPEHTGTYTIANTIRALLDLLYEGNFAVAQGMNEDFICNSKYDNEVFEMVMKLRQRPNWEEIDSFMGKEYKLKWLKYKEKEGYAR